MKRWSTNASAVLAVGAMVTVASASGAWAADVSGSLIKAVEVNKWTPPSPDPSGIAVAPGGNLTITDGEVEETTFYKNANVFHTTRAGDLQSTADTTGFSDEPTGVAYGPNGSIIISDDDLDEIIIASGFADSSPTRIKTGGFMTDPEGVAYDTFRKEILIANGEGGAGFVRYGAGSDERFGTNDDVHGTKISVAGAVDTEGVAYDGVRDTVLLLDSGASEKIYEMTANGTVINTISLAGISGLNQPAGIEVAAASSGSGRSYYIVDRGQDPGTTSTVNDGMMYEVQATGLSSAGPGVNQPPTANAGPDKVITTTDELSLTGTGSDPEGKSVAFAWTKAAGPGTVTFSAANSASTAARFSAAGEYVLRLTVTDADGAPASDDVKVLVGEAGGTATVTIPVSASSDDAREGDATAPTFVSTTTKTNDLGAGMSLTGANANIPYPTKVGVRFGNLPVPKGGEIVSAKIQFMADSLPSAGTASLKIFAEASDSAATYANTPTTAKVSGRTYGATSVAWAPPDWTTANERGANQLTPDLKAILQEVVNRAGWTQGSAVAFKIEGTGRRIARAYDAATATGSTALAAPSLVLQFKMTGPPPPVNAAPTVSAGADSAVTMPAAANLNGTVADDGLPNPPAKVTTTWSKVSGPGTVSFGTPNAADTTATFSAAGDYTLRLTANDGALSGQDDVVVKVTAAPTGGGGGGGGGGTTNTAPSVSVGPDQAVTSGTAAQLDATVTDDGQPAPYTVAWTKVSGPGTVTFANAKAADTTATFSQAGAYTLRLTANDSALTGHDDLVVTVADEAAETVAVTLAGPQRVLVSGQRSRLHGRVTIGDDGTGGQLVRLFVRRAKGQPFRFLANVATRDDGTFVYRDLPGGRTVYMAQSNGERSTRVVVRVKPRLTARVTDATVKRHERTTIRGSVSPAHEGQRLRLQQWNGRRWRVVATIVLPDGDRMSYRFHVRNRTAGTKVYRVVSPAFAGMARAVAPHDGLRIQVRRAG